MVPGISDIDSCEGVSPTSIPAFYKFDLNGSIEKLVAQVYISN
jgi:hypothetical protein